MNLTKSLLANAFALTAAILWVVCSAFVWLLPNLSLKISKWWVHGMKVSALGQFNLTLNNFLLGGVTLVVAMWVTGYVFGWALEYLQKQA